MKVIQINTPKGQVQMPLRPVAEHRANYYSCEVDEEEKNSKAWNDEVDFLMNDSYEAIDWLINNTDWIDWKDQVTKINDKVKVIDDDFWTNSEDFEIIENNI